MAIQIAIKNVKQKAIQIAIKMVFGWFKWLGWQLQFGTTLDGGSGTSATLDSATLDGGTGILDLDGGTGSLDSTTLDDAILDGSAGILDVDSGI